MKLTWLIGVVVLSGVSCVRERPPERPSTIEIPIQDIAFSVPTATVKIGDTVEWINKDVIAHTATGKNSEWNVVMAPNERGRFVADTVGPIDYYCSYHPNMTARIVVTNTR